MQRIETDLRDPGSRRPAPDRHVVEWIAARPPSTLYLSALMPGKVRRNIDPLTDRKRRAALLALSQPPS